MKPYLLKFQTSELIPPPYSHAIELSFIPNNDAIEYTFSLEYLDRQEFTSEELAEEGFSEFDNYALKGVLNSTWKEEVVSIFEKSEQDSKTHIEEEEDYWEISNHKNVFYPKNLSDWKKFLEEIHQAILEESRLEKPLEIKIIRKRPEEEIELNLKGIFSERKLIFLEDGVDLNKKWEKLNSYLKNIFSGEFRYEQASKKTPKGNGIFINLGDDYWFELGKTYLNEPSKIKKLFSKD